MATEINRKITLRNCVILRIRQDKRLRNRLALDLDTTSSTLYRWLRTGHILLTTAQCLNIISEHTGIPVADLTELEEISEPIEV